MAKASHERHGMGLSQSLDECVEEELVVLAVCVGWDHGVHSVPERFLEEIPGITLTERAHGYGVYRLGSVSQELEPKRRLQPFGELREEACLREAHDALFRASLEEARVGVALDWDPGGVRHYSLLVQDLLSAPNNFVNGEVKGNVLRIEPLRLIKQIVEIRP